MAKFDLFNFDLTGGMTDREFKDTLGAASAFCIYEDATGIHSHTAKATSGLFYNGSLSSVSPSTIIAIGAGVTNLSNSFKNCVALKRVYARNWDTSKITTFEYAFINTGLENADFSNFDTSSVTNFTGLVADCAYLKSLGLPTIPAGCTTWNFAAGCVALTTLYFGEGCKIYPSLSFSSCPLTYQSVCNVLDALADTPDEGATITFKSGLYAGFTEEQQAVIDGKVADVVANGWTIVNMGA